ncbi:hypothetical protein LTR64_008707 [Lithohypha guttulata]|uniref:uncharacterized protein n=1 Tax=Lithohypha guttulata TaxID=1690604 RepID=UPI002DDE8FBA|nr:hypothetical protein LTR51_008686 [Lithohypha guttulata]
MKAALATRPAADPAARYAQLQQAATQNTTNAQQASGQSAFTQVAIFNGFMLDARVSITCFCMMGIFIYFMARLRVKAPKMALLSIFAIVISDVYITSAPLIPQFVGTLPQSLLIPTGVAIGAGVACNILFFPRSTSHLALDGMQDLLLLMRSFLEACQLNFQYPYLRMDLDRLHQTKAQILEIYGALEGNVGFLKLDASMGRWSADDITALQAPLRQVLVACAALLHVQMAHHEPQSENERLETLAKTTSDSISKETRSNFRHPQDTQVFDFRQRFVHPDTDHLMEMSLLALSSSGEDLINT